MIERIKNILELIAIFAFGFVAGTALLILVLMCLVLITKGIPLLWSLL